MPLCLLEKKPPGSEHLLQRYLDRLGSDVEKEHLPLVVCYSYKDVPWLKMGLGALQKDLGKLTWSYVKLCNRILS